MKNRKRWLVLALATVLCLSLCGCDELETMRSEHAVWQEDGSILWNGTVYRKLENVENIDVLDVSYDYAGVYVTEPDVPVLLSSWFGESLDVCGNGTLLEYYDYRPAEDKTEWYCREDVYDETAALLEKGIEMTTYFYEYYNSSTNDFEKYYLTKEQSEAVNTVFATVQSIFNFMFEEPYIEGVYFYACDDSHRFESDIEMYMYTTESGYCIEFDDLVYVVPVEYHGIFAEIWMAYDDGNNAIAYPPSVVV